MKQAFYDAFMDNPIVAAIKDEEGLEVCIRRNDLQIVFVLYGEATTIGQIADRLKEAGKTVMVHIDLVGGLSGREEAVRFIKAYTKADGIISTKPELVRYAKEIGLYTVYRIFVIDSKALKALEGPATRYADLVEILPGLMPRIIKKAVTLTRTPVIAGGLISEKEDVIQALDAGAIAISATNRDVWDM